MSTTVLHSTSKKAGPPGPGPPGFWRKKRAPQAPQILAEHPLGAPHDALGHPQGLPGEAQGSPQGRPKSPSKPSCRRMGVGVTRYIKLELGTICAKFHYKYGVLI